MPDALLSTADAALALNLSERRVRALIAKGRLPAERVGATLVIRAADLERIRHRPPGRPKRQPA